MEIRNIPGLSGYGASADGRIWSMWQWGKRKLSNEWREMTQHPKRNGKYMLTHLGHCGEQHTYQVHRLVVMAFIGDIPPGMVVNHKDGNPKNNNLSNLEVCTQQWNEIHAFLNHLHPRGEDHVNTIYKENTIRQIKQEYARGGITQRKLSEKYSVKISTVQAVLSGRMWKHV